MATLITIPKRAFIPSRQNRAALTDENSPFYVGGGFYVIKAMTHAVSRIEDSFKNGGGMLWGEHDPELFVGTERFFRPGYAAHLIASWIPALSAIIPLAFCGLCVLVVCSSL